MNEDLAELAELMGRFFAAVSFEKGGRPSYGDLPSLVTEGARLVKTTPPEWVAWGEGPRAGLD